MTDGWSPEDGRTGDTSVSRTPTIHDDGNDDAGDAPSGARTVPRGR